MAKELVEITGFEELTLKIKRLSDDKDKRKALIKILRNSAKSTVKVARNLAPKGSGNVEVNNKSYRRKNRKIFKPKKGTISYQSGYGSKSITTQVMRKARLPMIIVGPRSLGNYDGYYLRQFVIPGYNIYRTGFKRNRRGKRDYNATGAKSRVSPNNFMEAAKMVTQRKVLESAVPQTERYLQKIINQL